MSDEDYARGWQDGKANKDPNPDRLAYGANRLNDYEIGYLDSGMGEVPQRWPEGWAIPNSTPPSTADFEFVHRHSHPGDSAEVTK